MADWINLLANGTRPDQVSGAFQAGFDDARQRQQAAQDRQFKLQAQQQAITSQAAARTGIAAALSSGNYDAAAAQAALYGDDKSATVLAGIGKDHLDRAGKNTTALANISNSVLALPYGERAAAIQSAKPLLVAQGLDPHAIDQFDPTDNNIRSLGHVDYSYGQGVKDAIEQQTADTGSYNAQTNRLTATQPVVMSQGQSMVGRDGNLVYQAPQTISAPMGDNVITLPGTTGSAPITQQQAWANMVGPTGRGGAEGGTNRDGSFRTSPKGAVGPAQVMPGTAPEAARLAGLPWDPQRYASDPQYNLALGQAYHNSLVQKYGGDIPKSVAAYNAGPGRVDRAIAQATKAGDPTKWANYLPGETQGYLQKVMGPGSRAVAAPITIQNGRDPNAVATTDPAVEMAARQYAATGEMPALGNGNGPMRKAILTRAAEISKNWSPAQIQANKADMKASSAALANDQKSYDTIQGAEQTALANGQVFLDRSRAAPGNTSIPLYNTARNALGQMTGDTRVTDMNAAYQTFLTEYAKVISATPSGAGQLSDSARHEAMDTLQNSAGYEAKAKAFQVLRQDMENRRLSQQRVIAQRQNHLAHIGDPAPQAASNVPPAAAQYLRAHPETRGHFDRTFGAGASASVLGS